MKKSTSPIVPFRKSPLYEGLTPSEMPNVVDPSDPGVRVFPVTGKEPADDPLT